MLSTTALSFFFFNDTATTEIYTLSLHDALPILAQRVAQARRLGRQGAQAQHGAQQCAGNGCLHGCFLSAATRRLDTGPEISTPCGADLCPIANLCQSRPWRSFAFSLAVKAVGLSMMAARQWRAAGGGLVILKWLFSVKINLKSWKSFLQWEAPKWPASCVNRAAASHDRRPSNQSTGEQTNDHEDSGQFFAGRRPVDLGRAGPGGGRALGARLRSDFAGPTCLQRGHQFRAAAPDLRNPGHPLGRRQIGRAHV